MTVLEESGQAGFPDADGGQFDVVVVGGGSAGCVLAARLSEDPTTRVLLLEAGPTDRHPYIRVPAAFPKLFGSRFDWGDRTEPQPALGGRCVYFPRGHVLGGSSSINAMMWIRGLPADFDAWSALAGPGWSWQSVLPYFLRIEDTDARLAEVQAGTYGRGGPLAVQLPRDLNPLTSAWLQAAAALGMAPLLQNAEDRDGVAASMLTQQNGVRRSAAAAYLRPAMRRTNLTVRTGALVERVVLDGRRATGVAYLIGRRRAVARARREVLVSAGAIGSPGVLWRSGIGPAEELRSLGITPALDLPAVGEQLQDHLTSGLVLASRSPVTLAAAQTLRQAWRFLVHRRGLLTSNVAEGYGYLRSDPELALPDLEVLFAPVAFLEEGLVVPKVHGMTCGAILLQPASRGRVSLRSADPAEPPRIDPRYLSDDGGTDLLTLAAGLRWCMRVVQQQPLAGLVGETILPELADPPLGGEALVEAAIRDHAQTLYHPAGTCAMGDGPAAVLDPELRVRGVGGLRVVDASAMPRIVRGHTNAATLMLAERASDLVRATLR